MLEQEGLEQGFSVGQDKGCGGPGPSPGRSQRVVSMRTNNGCPFPVLMLFCVQPHLAQRITLPAAVLLT